MKKYVFEYGRCTFVGQSNAVDFREAAFAAVNSFIEANRPLENVSVETTGFVTNSNGYIRVYDEERGVILYDIEVVSGIRGWLRRTRQALKERKNNIKFKNPKGVTIPC